MDDSRAEFAEENRKLMDQIVGYWDSDAMRLLLCADNRFEVTYKNGMQTWPDKGTFTVSGQVIETSDQNSTAGHWTIISRDTNNLVLKKARIYTYEIEQTIRFVRVPTEHGEKSVSKTRPWWRRW